MASYLPRHQRRPKHDIRAQDDARAIAGGAWDRLFGSFEPERERVRYGLTTNIETFNPVRVAFHEYAALARDLRGALLAHALEPDAARPRLQAGRMRRAYLSRRESRRSLSTRPSVWSRGQ